MEFLSHGFKYVFPPAKGSLARGVPTGASAEPLKSSFLDDGDPPGVWPHSEGKVRGIAFAPLYKGAPEAALRDPNIYSVLALCDAVRGGERENETSRSNYSARRSMPDPNRPLP